MLTATNAMQKANIKHAIYDSVFAALMSQPENQLEAYLALHPEARGRITVDDIKDASIKNVFYNASYNDLSFVAEGRRIVMIEAQSTWSDNIGVYGKGQKAVEETLRICREKNYLVPFLTERAAEVEATMMTIFSQEYATAMFEKTTREEGRAEGRADGLLSVVLNMLKEKFPFDQIAKATGFSVSEVERMAAEHQLA